MQLEAGAEGEAAGRSERSERVKVCEDTKLETPLGQDSIVIIITC